jgi:maltose/moltooligosaccharide transporter
MGMNKDAVDGNAIPLITKVAFMIGAVLSLTTIVFSVMRVKELPLSQQQIAEMKAKAKGMGATLKEIWDAVVEMPTAMRQLALMKLFQWYGMVCYWQYITYSLAKSLFDTSDVTATGYRDAVLVNGQIGGFYNAVAFVAGLALVPFARRYGSKLMHAVCLTLAGLGMLALPGIHDKWLLFVPMIGIGVGWASIMGNPYVMLANSIPPARTGVYMGIFNMFIVIPMLIQSATLGYIYDHWLGRSAGNVIMLAGALLLCAAVATLFVKVPRQAPTDA